MALGRRGLSIFLINIKRSKAKRKEECIVRGQRGLVIFVIFFQWSPSENKKLLAGSYHILIMFFWKSIIA